MVPLAIPAPSWMADDSDLTVIGRPHGGAPLAHVAPPATHSLRFETGELLAVGRGIVIGRDPADDPSLPGAARVAIADLSISKSHLSIGADSAGVFVIDRFSTNGTTFVADGRTTPCPPGEQCRLRAGAVVQFGDLSLTVVSS